MKKSKAASKEFNDCSQNLLKALQRFDDIEAGFSYKVIQ
jgi:hypothetical protein